MAPEVHSEVIVKVRCTLCHGTGTTEYAVEEREFLSLPGPVPLDPFTGRRRDVVVARFGKWSGLGPEHSEQERLAYFNRVAVSDAMTLAEYPDDLLIEYRARLRRQLAMLDDDTEPLIGDSTRALYFQVDREYRWRQKAFERGGPPLNTDGLWKDRIERAKRDVDLVALIAWENRKPKRVSAEKWQCCCPFHQDESPSLNIDAEKGVWFCHGCNLGGDCFTYVMQRYGMTFWRSLQYLEARLEITTDGAESGG